MLKNKANILFYQNKLKLSLIAHSVVLETTKNCVDSLIGIIDCCIFLKTEKNLCLKYIDQLYSITNDSCIIVLKKLQLYINMNDLEPAENLLTQVLTKSYPNNIDYLAAHVYINLEKSRKMEQGEQALQILIPIKKMLEDKILGSIINKKLIELINLVDKNILKLEECGNKSSASEISVRAENEKINTKKNKYSYLSLKHPGPFPDDVDPTCREFYLSDEDFKVNM
jgi:hypothetical protein